MFTMDAKALYYCKPFEVEKLHGFHESISNLETVKINSDSAPMQQDLATQDYHVARSVF